MRSTNYSSVAIRLVLVGAASALAAFLIPLQQWEREALQFAALFAACSAPLQLMAERKGLAPGQWWVNTQILLGLWFLISGHGLLLVLFVSVAFTRLFDLPIAIGAARGSAVWREQNRRPASG